MGVVGARRALRGGALLDEHGGNGDWDRDRRRG